MQSDYKLKYYSTIYITPECVSFSLIRNKLKKNIFYKKMRNDFLHQLIHVSKNSVFFKDRQFWNVMLQFVRILVKEGKDFPYFAHYVLVYFRADTDIVHFLQNNVNASFKFALSDYNFTNLRKKGEKRFKSFWDTSTRNILYYISGVSVNYTAQPLIFKSYDAKFVVHESCNDILQSLRWCSNCQLWVY